MEEREKENQAGFLSKRGPENPEDVQQRVFFLHVISDVFFQFAGTRGGRKGRTDLAVATSNFQ